MLPIGVTYRRRTYAMEVHTVRVTHRDYHEVTDMVPIPGLPIGPEHRMHVRYSEISLETLSYEEWSLVRGKINMICKELATETASILRF